MDLDSVLAAVSKHRLGGEPVPEDLKILLAHRDELSGWLGCSLPDAPDWAPWLDTSYLSEKDWADPGIRANVRAMEDVCRHIAFVAQADGSELFGYWRGQQSRRIRDCPLVRLDTEGQFALLPCATLAGALLLDETFSQERYEKFRDWLKGLGIECPAWEDRYADERTLEKTDDPHWLHWELQRRYLPEETEAS
jgi:hypothetical protein